MFEQSASMETEQDSADKKSTQNNKTTKRNGVLITVSQNDSSRSTEVLSNVPPSGHIVTAAPSNSNRAADSMNKNPAERKDGTNQPAGGILQEASDPQASNLQTENVRQIRDAKLERKMKLGGIGKAFSLSGGNGDRWQSIKHAVKTSNSLERKKEGHSFIEK